ncbi:hypothetical protein HAX54_007937, partial [Datura stramonium]|nr:hypothetical protein [Datura stramonium]
HPWYEPLHHEVARLLEFAQLLHNLTNHPKYTNHLGDSTPQQAICANLKISLTGEEICLVGKGEIGALSDTSGIGESLGPERSKIRASDPKTQQANKNLEWHRSNNMSGLPLELFCYNLSHLNVDTGHDASYESGHLNKDMCSAF